MENFKVSLSGIRGIVGESLSYNIVFNLGLAFAEFSKGKILVGRDTRPSGKKFSEAILRALRYKKQEALDLGVLPTPTVLFLVKKMKAGGGVVITASHNPSNWNGLKFINARGTFLNSQELEKLLNNFEKIKTEPVRGVKTPSYKYSESLSNEVLNDYIQTIIKNFDQDLIKKRNFKIGIDPVNGAGVLVTRRFLEKLNCQVFSLNENPDGQFGRPPEPLVKNLKGLSQLVKKYHLDLGFAQDPDADRLAIVSESGIPIGEEYTLALAFQAWLNRANNTLGKKRALVINLATTQMIEDLAQKVHWKVWRTKVGEVNVVEKMKEIGASFGGEGNGGVICPSINWGRDSFVGIGLILELVSSANKKISQLIKDLPRYSRFNDKIIFSSLNPEEIFEIFKNRFKSRLKNYQVDLADGIRVAGKNFWWLVRPSNTEPVIRIMGEARSKFKAKTLLESLKKELKEEIISCPRTFYSVA